MSICNNTFHAEKLSSPSNPAMLNGLCGRNHKKIQASIAEINNMGDIWRLSGHYITVFIAFSHSRIRSTLSIRHHYRGFTAKLCHRSRGPTMNAIPIPAITAVSVIKLAPLPQYYHTYCSSTAVPIPMQLSSLGHDRFVCLSQTFKTKWPSPIVVFVS